MNIAELIKVMLERRAESREYVDAICEAREQEKQEHESTKRNRANKKTH
jgi:hypothetical protein